MIEELLVAAGVMSGEKYKISFVSEPFCRCAQGNLTAKMLANAMCAIDDTQAIDQSMALLDSNLRFCAVKVELYNGGYCQNPTGARIELEMRRHVQGYSGTIEYEAMNSPRQVLATLTIEKK
ncbi:hypothetical protein J4219_02610 [Candidatus Woesearchaeota archaeon]|nr:hypothetical protein [Candidatus Woesearchaeota archaeon]